MLFSVIKAEIIYVNQNATGSNNGSSWENAFNNLSTALIHALPNDEIWVAQGVYKPEVAFDFNSSGGTDPREATFNIPSGVQLFGGFSGIETYRNQRNWNVYLTVLSADIDNNDIDSNHDGIIESVDDIVGKNAYHVLYANTNDYNTVIDGFIVNAGFAKISYPISSDDPNFKGGGYYYRPLSANLSNKEPLLINMTFKANYAKLKGGAIYSESIEGDGILNGDIKNCKFISNVSGSEGGAIFAGTKYAPYEDIIFVIKRCEFNKNEAYEKGGAIFLINDFSFIDSSVFISNKTMVSGSINLGCGGALYLEHSNMSIFSSIFKRNVATGSPTEIGGGGAIFTCIDHEQSTQWSSSLRIVSCTFHQNIAGGNGSAFGGAILNLNLGGAHHPRITSCMFYNNGAHDGGGAVANILNAPLWQFDPLLTNCTFNANHAVLKGGALYNKNIDESFGSFRTKIDNCVLWKNTAADDNTAEIYSMNPVRITYSLVKGSGGSGTSWNPTIGIDGGNNIDMDPLFTDIVFLNGTIIKGLVASSPGINAGNNSLYEISLNNLDVMCKPRIQDGTVDMGAYEYTDMNPKIIYVNHLAIGSSDGSSWQNAFMKLSTALNKAHKGDEIWVAQGIYKPEKIVDLNYSFGVDPREVTFRIPDGVQIFGGFFGNESSRNDRNWEKYKTVLSGDIDNNDNDPNTDGIIETVDDIVGKNAYHVVYSTSFKGDTIDGFIINAGSADISNPKDNFEPNLNGGGLFYRPYDYERLEYIGSDISGPTIQNTIFKANFAKLKGGGIYNERTYEVRTIRGHVVNCEFISNAAKLEGGAIFIGDRLNPLNQCWMNIKKCNFKNNEAHQYGGALCLLGDFTKIDSCAFTSNKVMSSSPLLYGSGGAAYLEVSNAVFSNCIFNTNVATGGLENPDEIGGGGAIYAYIDDGQTANMWSSNPKFLNCIFYKNISGGNGIALGGAVLNVNKGGAFKPEFANCMFYNNGAHDDGGALAIVLVYPNWKYESFVPTLTNCTFTKNHAINKGGALFFEDKTDPYFHGFHGKIENCILWKNTSMIDGTEEIYSTLKEDTFAYSIIKGSNGSGPSWEVAIGINGGNNLDQDPLFTEIFLPWGTIGATLSASSPAINAGNNNAKGLLGISTDLIGNPRIQENIVDMGAFETQGSPAIAISEDHKFLLYPSPAKDYVSIKHDNSIAKEQYILEVYNLNGQLMKQKSMISDIQTIELNDLNSGVYLLKISSPDNKAIYKKIIKE